MILINLFIGGILTVADDLLKNDGKKFLDMMERLAERRMQKEDNTSDQSNNYFQEDEDDDDNFEDEEDDVCFFLQDIFSFIFNVIFLIGHAYRRTTYGRRSSYVSNFCCTYV